MALSSRESTFLESLFDATALQSGGDRLTAWERQFVQDMAQRYDQYGPETYISPKQWAVINRIGGKVGCS